MQKTMTNEKTARILRIVAQFLSMLVQFFTSTHKKENPENKESGA